MAKEIFDISGTQTGFSFNTDLSPYDMPANMFSSVQNVRFNDKQAGSIQGHSQALGTPGVAHTGLQVGDKALLTYGYTVVLPNFIK